MPLIVVKNNKNKSNIDDKQIFKKINFEKLSRSLSRTDSMITRFALSKTNIKLTSIEHICKGLSKNNSVTEITFDTCHFETANGASSILKVVALPVAVISRLGFNKDLSSEPDLKISISELKKNRNSTLRNIIVNEQEINSIELKINELLAMNNYSTEKMYYELYLLFAKHCIHLSEQNKKHKESVIYYLSLAHQYFNKCLSYQPAPHKEHISCLIRLIGLEITDEIKLKWQLELYQLHHRINENARTDSDYRNLLQLAIKLTTSSSLENKKYAHQALNHFCHLKEKKLEDWESFQKLSPSLLTPEQIATESTALLLHLCFAPPTMQTYNLNITSITLNSIYHEIFMPEQKELRSYFINLIESAFQLYEKNTLPDCDLKFAIQNAHDKVKLKNRLEDIKKIDSADITSKERDELRKKNHELEERISELENPTKLTLQDTKSTPSTSTTNNTNNIKPIKSAQNLLLFSSSIALKSATNQTKNWHQKIENPHKKTKNR